MRSPMLFVDDDTIRYGLFRHYIADRYYVASPSMTERGLLPNVLTCDTRLPANFCACGCYMLFEQD